MAVIAVLISCSNSKTESTAAAETTTVATAETKPEAEPEAAASIVGTWKLKDIDLGMTPPKGQEAKFDNMKKEMIEKTVYVFAEDGTINLTNNITKSSGTYSLEGDKLSTVISNRTETTTVQTLTASELVLVIEDRGMKMVMTFQK